jgi:hypothetical protein
LKECTVPIRVGEANIAGRPLEPVSVAAIIHGRKPALDLDPGCRDPVNAYSAHPTGKSIGVGYFVVTAASRAEQNCSLLEV